MKLKFIYAELESVLKFYKEKGGTFEDAMQLVCIVYDKNVDAIGHMTPAEPVATVVPVASTGRGDEGQAQVVKTKTTPKPVPKSTPTTYVNAARKNARSMSKSIMDTFRVSTGEPIGDVTFGQLPYIARKASIEASVVSQILNYTTVTDMDMQVRHAVPVDVLDKMVKRARMENHNV